MCVVVLGFTHTHTYFIPSEGKRRALTLWETMKALFIPRQVFFLFFSWLALCSNGAPSRWADHHRWLEWFSPYSAYSLLLKETNWFLLMSRAPMRSCARRHKGIDKLSVRAANQPVSLCSMPTLGAKRKRKKSINRLAGMRKWHEHYKQQNNTYIDPSPPRHFFFESGKSDCCLWRLMACPSLSPLWKKGGGAKRRRRR